MKEKMKKQGREKKDWGKKRDQGRRRTLCEERKK